MYKEILYPIIQYDRKIPKIDTANHVAYTTYATT